MVEAVTTRDKFVAALAPMVVPAGIVIVHGAGTGVAWVTMNVLPSIVMVPRRGLGPGLGATEYVTAPLPVPALPFVIVIHGALLTDAVQAQAAEAVVATVAMLPAPPLAPII